MLKPKDLANVDFRVAWRGYHQDDVDEFVRKIVAAYEDLYQEQLRLQEHAQELKARIAEYSQTEVQIDETLALARQTAADVKAAAQERARAMLAEAKVEGEQLVRDARRRAEEHLARAQELTRQERAFRERFRDLLESYWALLEEERRDAEQLTQSMMQVASQVAAGRDKSGTEAASLASAFDGDDGSDDDGIDFHDGEDYSGPLDDDDPPTRRMEAIDSDDIR